VPHSTRTIRRRLSALVLAALGMLGTASVVVGHAELVSSSPAANAVLVDAPDRVELTFSERIDPATAFVDLLDPSQRSIEGVGPVEVDSGGTTAVATLPDLAPGVYTVSYQVVSAVDGHPTTGILAFLVDPDGTGVAPSAPPASTTPPVQPSAVVGRWIGLVAALVAFGSLVMWLNAGRRTFASVTPGALRGRDGPPWWLVTVAGLATVAGMSTYLVIGGRPLAASVGLQGGLPIDPAAPFGWTPFAIAMRVTLVAGLLTGLLAAWGALRGGGLRLALAALVLGATALAGMSSAGHASAAGGAGFAAVDWVHLLAAGAWLGALPAGFVLANRGRSAGVSARQLGMSLLRAHGPLALVAAPIVALTGIANSPLVLGSGRDLAASSYGNLVLAKAGLLAVAVGIGAVNFVMLRRRRPPARALIAVELAVAALAVLTAATMVSVPPATSRQAQLVTAPATPAHLFGTVGPSSVHLNVNLPTPGNQTYGASIVDATTGAPRDDIQRVYLDFTPPASSGLPGQERVEMEPGRIDGSYVATGAFTPVEGVWGLDLVVRRQGELDERLVFSLPVSTPPEPELVAAPSTGIDVPGPIGMLWPLLPTGPLAWWPVVVGLGGLWLVGRSHLPEVARWAIAGALVGMVLLGGAVAGSRALVTAANAPPSDLEPLDVPTDPAALARGEDLYRANCASCHGVDGDGRGPIRTLPPAGPLAEPISGMSPAELGYRIANGLAGTPMPGFAAVMPESDRLELIAYLRSRWADE